MLKASLPAAFFLLMVTAQPSAAYEGPWCAQFNLAGGAFVCNFFSFEQCRESVSGVGGQCVPNPRYRDEPRRRWRG